MRLIDAMQVVSARAAAVAGVEHEAVPGVGSIRIEAGPDTDLDDLIRRLLYGFIPPDNLDGLSGDLEAIGHMVAAAVRNMPPQGLPMMLSILLSQFIAAGAVLAREEDEQA